MDSLTSFLRMTEHSSGGLEAPTTKGITYPFVYVEKLSNVELTYLRKNKVLTDLQQDENSVPFYLKLDTGGYKFLGYMSMTFEAVVQTQCLRRQSVFLKANKDTSGVLTQELLYDLLLI